MAKKAAQGEPLCYQGRSASIDAHDGPHRLGRRASIRLGIEVPRGEFEEAEATDVLRDAAAPSTPREALAERVQT